MRHADGRMCLVSLNHESRTLRVKFYEVRKVDEISNRTLARAGSRSEAEPH